jgi:hypothetical protein
LAAQRAIKDARTAWSGDLGVVAADASEHGGAVGTQEMTRSKQPEMPPNASLILSTARRYPVTDGVVIAPRAWDTLRKVVCATA